MEMNINDIMKEYYKVGCVQFKYTIPEKASKCDKTRNHVVRVLIGPTDI
jgi:hypothetical protein